MRFMQYRSTRKSVFSVKYHVIWCPKYRRDVLRGPILARVKCLWSPSWFVSTVGGAPLVVVRRYVEDQTLAAARQGEAA